MVKLIEHINNIVKNHNKYCRCLTESIEVDELPKFIIIYIDQSVTTVKDCIINFSSDNIKLDLKNELKSSLFDNKICYNMKDCNNPFIIVTPKKDFYLLKNTQKYYLQYDIKFSSKINKDLIKIYSILF